MEKFKLDPRNVRKHGKRNQQVIAESLRELGAGRSILIDSSNTAVAGNGVLEQAEKLGIPIRIVESDGSELIAVKRVDLSPDDPKRKALAIADNRASDLSLFDEDAMSKLLSECGPFKTKSGFNSAELEKMNLLNADDSTEKPVDPELCYSAQVQPRQLWLFFLIFSRRHGASALNLLATAGVPLRSVRNSGGKSS